MDRPYSISDFAFPNRWDRDEGPDLMERVGRGSRTDSELGRGGSGKGSGSGHPHRPDRSRTIYRGRERVTPRFAR